MATADKTIPFSIGAPPSSSLEAQAAGMAENSWRQISLPGLSALLADVDTGLDIFAYTQKGVWQPQARRIVIIPQEHGTQYASRKIIWSNATNAWLLETPPIPNGSVSHGYYLTAVDPATDKLFFHLYQSRSVRAQAFGGSWADAQQDNLDGVCYSGGLEWLPGLNSGAGGLVFGHIWGVTTSNAAVSSWTVRGTGAFIGGTLTMSDGGTGSAYDPVDDAVLLIGGGTAATSCVRVTNTGAVSQRANLPFACYASSSGSVGGIASSGLSGLRPMIFGTGSGNVRRYTGTGTDTWQSLSTLPYTVQSTNPRFLCIPINDALIRRYLHINCTGQTAEFWFYRPPES